jgi:hypothetical protein
VTRQTIVHGEGGRFWLQVVSVATVYLALQFGLLLGTGDGWQKFSVAQPASAFEYWDAIHYATLAVNPLCGAFYPLWPALVAAVGSPDSLDQALRLSIVGSELLFLLSLPLALFTFRRILQHRALALLAFVLYALGPNAIFQSIGYTESLFGLLSLLFLLALHRVEQGANGGGPLTLGLYGAIAALAALLNLTRPALIQSWFAIAFALGLLYLLRPGPLNQRVPPRTLTTAGVVAAGSLLGYSLYGLFCLRTLGDFFWPFQSQVEWGRTLALRPGLLLLPRSLLIDLHGLYTPMLILAALGWLGLAASLPRSPTLWLPKSPWLYALLIHPLVFSLTWLVLWLSGRRGLVPLPVRPPEQGLAYLGRFSVLYAIGFSGVHSLINLLANSGYLYSTARHYFGTPYAFVALGAVLAAVDVPRLNRLAWGIALVGLLLLGEQWFYYGTARLLG